eukprot:11982354-Alexandrium_andersonii.AAC.1
MYPAAWHVEAPHRPTFTQRPTHSQRQEVIPRRVHRKGGAQVAMVGAAPGRGAAAWAAQGCRSQSWSR